MVMMKVDVNNKYVPYKKLRMTIEAKSGVRPVMPSIAFNFGSEVVDILLISTIDQHVKGLTG